MPTDDEKNLKHVISKMEGIIESFSFVRTHMHHQSQFLLLTPLELSTIKIFEETLLSSSFFLKARSDQMASLGRIISLSFGFISAVQTIFKCVIYLTINTTPA